ncbi:hypothetical protein BGZ76_000882 [Entomortierella beljakovae]|nr:hypothetical protein BGZ76_000882 [Entomortierella beljakovae]
MSAAAIRILRSCRLGSCEPSSVSSPSEEVPLDPITLSNEFDRDQSIQDLITQLESAGFTDIAIIPVSLDTIVQVGEKLEKEMEERRWRDQDLVVFQLCDGTELDGYTGVSIIHELEQRKIAFTGAGSGISSMQSKQEMVGCEYFYIISSSKPVLKCELQAAQVPTSDFQEFSTLPRMEDLENIITRIGFPMIVKPSISYASINISLTSVVHAPDQLLEQINHSLLASGPNLKLLDQREQIQNDRSIREALGKTNAKIDIETPTVFVEKFLAGREFTALVVGDKDWGVKVYPVAERAFNPKLSKFERILAFDQYWEGYDLEGGSGDGEYCKYKMAYSEWQEQLQEVAKNAYLALNGDGYGRDTSSMANILIMSDVAPSGFVRDLVNYAIFRNQILNGKAQSPAQQIGLNSIFETEKTQDVVEALA